MLPTQPVPRKKSCTACTSSKVRCDLQRPSCSRCLKRGIQCNYLYDAAPEHPPTPVSATSSPATTTFGNSGVGGQFADPTVLDGIPTTPAASLFSTSTVVDAPASDFPPTQATSSPEEAADFSAPIQLLSAVDGSRIRDRWLDFYVVPIYKDPKNYSARSISLVTRVLRAYVTRWVRDRACLPPFVHPVQCRDGAMPVPLGNCLSLLCMCAGRVLGSERMIRVCIEQEMSRLFQEFDHCNQLEGLASLQAYLLLAIASFVFLTGPSTADTPEEFAQLFSGGTISTLQHLACKASQAGMVCPAEIDRRGRPPSWEAWIVAEAKRRTVYTLYMLESVWNFRNGVPSYISDELGLLPAPYPGAMWAATGRRVWEREYERHLRTWDGMPVFRMVEFWTSEDARPLAAGGGEGAVLSRSQRLDLWAEGVDDYGMFMLAICTATHGC